MPINRLAGLANLERGTAARVCVGATAICVARCEDGRIFAVSDACTHEDDARLSDGWVSDGQIECSRHNSIFDLQTGAALSFPAVEALQTFPVRVDADDVLIDVP